MNKNKIMTAIAISAVLAGCGGNQESKSASAAPTKQIGYFKDAAISGVTYTSPSFSGITGPQGQYEFMPGETVEFSIGSLSLGSAKAGAQITPIELTESPDYTDTKPTNMVRLLLALDADGNNDNGLQISDDVRDFLSGDIAISDLDFGSEAFSDTVSALISQLPATDDSGNPVDRQLPDIATANAHFKSTLTCAYSGIYVGEFEGEDQGIFGAVIDPATLTAKGALNPYDEENYYITELTASAPIVLTNPNQPLHMGITGSDAAFIANVSNYSAMSGNWAWTDQGGSGTFEGVKDLSWEVGAKYKYVGTFGPIFRGDDGQITAARDLGGLIQLSIDTDNNVSIDYYDLIDQKHFHNETVIKEGRITFNLSGELSENAKAADANFDLELPLKPQDGDIVNTILDDINGNEYFINMSSCTI